MDNKSIKEPIQKKWIWIILFFIILGNVPWYFQSGSIAPLVWGVPYWTLFIVAFAILLSAFTSWVIMTQWNIVEDEEEDEEKERKRGIEHE
ncbi:hypothetical protein [Indiicoccus explosivorum]|uniref:hypothetical protein n=1 Tax=Indiicoccus explosivorum TaxID=1917864 RepID=UPI000B447E5A|nr:hypothetical protein [Indiicoccus explosivorum]